MRSAIIKLPAREPASRGYTLIELMVALTIAALIFLVGYGGYRDFVRRQALDNANKDLRSDLKLAQQSALSGEKPSSCSGALSGYQVAFAQNSYTVSANCGGSFILVRQRNLPAGITLSGLSSLVYKVVGEGTNLTSDVSVTLTQASTSRTKIINISKEGTFK